MISNAFQCVFDQLFPVKSEASELIHSSNLPDVTSVISRSSLTKMPYMAAHSSCDSSSILMSTSCPPPPYHNLSSQHKQIYDNPAILRLEQPTSTTISVQSSRESHSSLMPPPKCPPPVRDLSKKSLLLESQLMPPPKVIPSCHGEGRGSSIPDMSSSPSTSMRASSNYTGHDKEDIGKLVSHNHNMVVVFNFLLLSTVTVLFPLGGTRGTLIMKN